MSQTFLSRAEEDQARRTRAPRKTTTVPRIWPRHGRVQRTLTKALNRAHEQGDSVRADHISRILNGAVHLPGGRHG